MYWSSVVQCGASCTDCCKINGQECSWACWLSHSDSSVSPHPAGLPPQHRCHRFQSKAVMSMSPLAVSEGKHRGERPPTCTYVVTAVSGCWQLHSSSAFTTHTAVPHPRQGCPLCCYGRCQTWHIRGQGATAAQPGGCERKGTKQGRICSGTKDICPWPEQLLAWFHKDKGSGWLIQGWYSIKQAVGS